jgi:GxxExxY protein
MQDNEITGEIVDAAMKIHKALGPGLFESVYQKVLAYELEQRKLQVEPKKIIPIRYGDLIIAKGFEADLIVEERVIVELKSIDQLAPVHSKQVLTYLRLTGMRLGLLINFNVPLLKDGLVRVVNGYEGEFLSAESPRPL